MNAFFPIPFSELWIWVSELTIYKIKIKEGFIAMLLFGWVSQSNKNKKTAAKKSAAVSLCCINESLFLVHTTSGIFFNSNVFRSFCVFNRTSARCIGL